MIHAVELGQQEIVETLLAKGADPNIVNGKGDTAGMIAQDMAEKETIPESGRRLKRQAIVDALIAHGAYIPGKRAPTADEKAAMTPAQLESYTAARFARGQGPEQKSRAKR